MKNIVLLIIDSFNYSHSKQNLYLTPFMNGLKEKGLFFDNMFSQAPYTEAAVMNIYCGQNVLDNGGYIKRFKDAEKTIFEIMKEKGYVTYFNSFQPQCYPSSLRRGVDYLFNNVGYDFDALWSYRLSFYADLFKKGAITDSDYALLTEILDDNFDEWMAFVNKLIDDDKQIEMIKNNSISYDPEQVKSLLSLEIKKYKNDKRKYIDSILSEKTNHSLFSIPAFIQDHKIGNESFVRGLRKEYLPFFKRIAHLNKSLNKRNCKGAYKGFWRKLGYFFKHPSLRTLKDAGKAFILSRNVFKDSDLFERINENYQTFKNAPSVKTHIDHYIEWESLREGSAPSFSCIHVDDIHNPEVFFTYDSDDKALIDSEFRDAQEVLEHIPNDYQGNITHDLSLRYIDTKIKYFYEQLDKHNLLEDTIVLICADHGFSFSGNPLRDSFVVNMYLENYNIPCVLTGTDYKGKIEGLRSSKDIPAILSFLSDGSVPLSFSGRANLDNKFEYDHLFIEYCGGGCPDLRRRKLKIGCFDKEWFVASESQLDAEINEMNVTEIYDLRNDPLQINNLKNKQYDRQKVSDLIACINNRRETIRKSL